MRGRLLSPLDAKLLRDLWAMRGQALAIAAVIAGGVAVYVVIAGMLASLTMTRDVYYDRTRFADVWASAVRAPMSLAEEIRAVEGVAAAEARIRTSVLFDVDTMEEPASGAILSLPPGRQPAVSAIHLAEGRLPDPARLDEAVILKSFADAHGLRVGDRVAATIRGRRESLAVVGVALSPEYVYAIAPGQLVPDPRLFGVLWMDRDALERAADMEGAFNDVAVRLTRGADPAPVLAALDRILEPYGAPGAYTRRDQISDAFVTAEIQQLETMGDVMPPVFLGVAAFLVNIVISRLIAVERGQIGLLKAFGYSSGAVARHYLRMVAVIAAFGLAAGIALGAWLGRGLAGIYVEFYSFPYLIFAATPGVYATAALVTAFAAGGGAALAVSRAARLEPAVAMRPPPPPDYSRGFGASAAGWRRLDQQSRMIVRQLLRWPVRAALTVTGVAASGALMVTAMFFTDAMEHMVRSYFDVGARYDAAARFVEPRSMAAFHDLARREGVIAAEPFREVSARLVHGHREVRAGLSGAPTDPSLSRTVDARNRAVQPPPGGLLLSQDLARRLGAQPGDVVRAEITEGRRPVLELPIAAAPDVLIGSAAVMPLDDLRAALGEGRTVSGAHLRVDPQNAGALYAELKATPLVAGVELNALARENFVALLDRNIGLTLFVYTGFAALIAVGVIYNSIRVSLAERERELASLRVLGFSKGDVSYILLGESALIVLLALPLAAAWGALLARGLAAAMSSDLYRIPFVIGPETFAVAGLVLILTAAASGLIVRRRIDRLDLVAVLKTRE